MTTRTIHHGEERMVILDPESGATISVPVKFIGEEIEEVNEDEKKVAADIKDYVDDHKKHFDAYPMDVEVEKLTIRFMIMMNMENIRQVLSS